MWYDVRGVVRNQYNLNQLTWFKVGGAAEFFFKPLDIIDLSTFLKQNQRKLPITMLGAGSNVIIRDGGVRGVVIKLGQNFANIEYADDSSVAVGAGCLNFNLSQYCLANSISGFEFLSGIPGTIGGGIIMNAGAYGSEFKDIVLAIEVIDEYGDIHIINNSEVGFKHRSTNLTENLIVTKAIFKTTLGEQEAIKKKIQEIRQQRLLTQPIAMRTGGSTFVNPLNHKAWQLIDAAGYRGYRIHDAGISDLHCNFMINHGAASAQELEDLGECVRNKVFTQSGIMLEWEIKRIGLRKQEDEIMKRYG